MKVTQDKPEPIVPDSELDFDEDLVYRWHGKLFTGIGYEDRPGLGRSEVSYRYGVQEGPARDWYPSGTMKSESFFRENVLHGVTREYREDGALEKEVLYEYGIRVEEKERNDRGEMIAKFGLDVGDKKYKLLERYRREKGWPLGQ
jgi:antitoxin component YwqK of YwqJK toxin-antitoxin module